MTNQVLSVTLDDALPQFGAVASSFVLPPDDMLAVPMWLPRRIVPQADGKPPKKVRVSLPDGIPTTMRNTFAGSYATAQAHMTTIGADGIGLVLGAFLQDGQIVGIDLDACRDPNSGEIKPWAFDVIKLADSHTQISFSGRGVKIFATVASADIPAIEAAIAASKDYAQGASRDCCIWSWRSKQAHGAKIEFFKSKRFFDFTGRHLTGSPIEFRQISLDTVLHLIREVGPAFAANDPAKAKPATPPAGHSTAHPSATNDNPPPVDISHPDNPLWERIEAAAEKHPELRKRLRGDFLGIQDQSRSGIAMAFGGALKRAGFSQEEMEQALREFGPAATWANEQDNLEGRGFQRIWDNAGDAPPERDPRADFADVKVIKFGPPLDPLADFNRSQKRAVRSMVRRSRQDLANLPALKWLYPGLIQALGLIFLVGAPKSLKSFIALLLAVCAAAGAPFAGIEPAAGPLRVALWVGEGVSGLHARLKAIEDYYGLDVGERLIILTGPFVSDEVIDLVKDDGVDVIIIDTLARAIASTNLDENSAKDMGAAVFEFDRIRDALNCLVILVHHSGKDAGRGMRGSSSLLAAADAVFTATKVAPGVSSFESVEMKEAATADPLVFELKKIGESAVAVLNERLTPTPSGVPSPPKGEIETLIIKIIEDLMPSGKLPVPPRGAAAPFPADVMTAAIASNGALVSSAREAFIMRRPGGSRAMKVQAFGRGLKSLQSKRQVLVVGEWVRPMNMMNREAV